MLALSFESADTGYIYYHWRWSRGIPVTAEERERYLSIPALGSRRAWRAAIAGRPSVPARVFQPVRRKLLAELPTRMVVMALLLGIPLAVSGLAELQTIGGLARSLCGLLAVVFGLQIAFAKYAKRRERYAVNGAR